MNDHPHTLRRRDFLKGTAALGIAAQTGFLARPAHAQGKDDGPSPALVVVYLRGGADFLNMVVPFTDDDYHAARPTIGLKEADGLVTLDAKWALHPALATMAPLYERGLFAPIVCAGSPHPTRSHFDAQDFMEFAAPGDRTVRSGWLNRYLAAAARSDAGDLRALGMQQLLPRSLRGPYPVLAVPTSLGTKESAEALEDFEDFYGPDGASGGMDARDEGAADVVGAGQATIETLRRFQELSGKRKKGKSSYPRSPFGRGLEAIARVLDADAGLEVAGIDYNGWDHHAGQGGADGRHAQMLADLSASLAAFCKHLGPRMARTCVLVMTEFGRTVRENGNSGTDHGHGGGMFLLGGGARGGEVHGPWPGLATETLYQGRDLQVTVDFRDVYATVLRELFDFKAPKGFFPAHKPSTLKLF
jgi:uncharacterized protein (DUF1501 family)